MSNKDAIVIVDRTFYWKARTARERNRYVPKGLPHSPIISILIDSRAFQVAGRIPKELRIRIETVPTDTKNGPFADTFTAAGYEFYKMRLPDKKKTEPL